jgi:hypothetical protein
MNENEVLEISFNDITPLKLASLSAAGYTGEIDGDRHTVRILDVNEHCRVCGCKAPRICDTCYNG